MAGEGTTTTTSGAGAGGAAAGSGQSGAAAPGGAAAAGLLAGGAPGAGATTPPGAAAAPVDWTKSLADNHRGVVEVKGWKDPGGIIEAYTKLEAHLGTPADRLLSLPKDPNDAKAMEAVWNRLGRPEKAEGYELPVPEGADPEFAKSAGAWFHAAGLSKTQAQAVTQAWNEHQAAQMKAQGEAAEQKRVADEAEIKQLYGPRFDAAIATAKKAVSAFVKDPAVIAQLEASMGSKAVVELFEAVGRRMGEAKAKGFEDAGGDGIPNTVEAIKEKIADLKRDKGWVKRYAAGDPKAATELDQLQKLLVARQAAG